MACLQQLRNDATTVEIKIHDMIRLIGKVTLGSVVQNLTISTDKEEAEICFKDDQKHWFCANSSIMHILAESYPEEHLCKRVYNPRTKRLCLCIPKLVPKRLLVELCAYYVIYYGCVLHNLKNQLEKLSIEDDYEPLLIEIDKVNKDLSNVAPFVVSNYNPQVDNVIFSFIYHCNKDKYPYPLFNDTPTTLHDIYNLQSNWAEEKEWLIELVDGILEGTISHDNSPFVDFCYIYRPIHCKNPYKS